MNELLDYKHLLSTNILVTVHGSTNTSFEGLGKIHSFPVKT